MTTTLLMLMTGILKANYSSLGRNRVIDTSQQDRDTNLEQKIRYD